MKFGARLYGTDPSRLVEVAQTIEAIGYESIWRGEHLVIPTDRTEPYPYSVEGTAPFTDSTPILEPLTLFGYLAANTSSVRFATGVCILPLREPYLLARMVTTLDVVSGGRAMLGVGAGWMRGEFEVVGEDFDRRGTLTSELIEALRALWLQDDPAFTGDLVTVGGARFEPKPVSVPHPPIIVGGESSAALRRAARFGDGWYGHAFEVDHIRERVETLRRLRAEAGRDEPFEVTVRVLPDVSIEHVRSLAAVGVDRAVLESGSFDLRDPFDALGAIESFGERIVAKTQEDQQ